MVQLGGNFHLLAFRHQPLKVVPEDTDRYCSWQVILEPPDGERRWRYVLEIAEREDAP